VASSLGCSAMYTSGPRAWESSRWALFGDQIPSFRLPHGPVAYLASRRNHLRSFPHRSVPCSIRHFLQVFVIQPIPFVLCVALEVLIHVIVISILILPVIVFHTLILHVIVFHILILHTIVFHILILHIITFDVRIFHVAIFHAITLHAVVFHVIHIASALTSPRSTSGAKRRPPLNGPRMSLCCTR